jgi:BRCA1-associated protein
VIALPDAMTVDNFLLFIEKAIPRIKYIRFIQDISTELEEVKICFNRVLIYFEDQDSADNFYYDFNSKCYLTNKFEYLYSVFVETVDICSDLLYTTDTIEYSKSELTCCPLCLEKLDESSSGIHTILSNLNVERWEGYKKYCKVCSNLQKENKCFKCELTTSLWCCVVCGFIGCDRYQKTPHGMEHFETTWHRYSIDLTTFRIWDYLGDSWVHRVLKIGNTDSTINLESKQDGEDSINSKEYMMRIENIISEYNFALTTQLEEQRTYYERELTVLKEDQERMLTAEYSQLNQLKESLKAAKHKAENNKRLIKEYAKKYNQLGEKIKETNESIELNIQITGSINTDIKKQVEPVNIVRINV